MKKKPLIFISHSSKNKAHVAKIAELLRSINLSPSGTVATFLRSCFISSVTVTDADVILSCFPKVGSFISRINLSLASSQIISSQEYFL